MTDSSTAGSTSDDQTLAQMTLMDHLVELRMRLLKVVLSIVLGSIVMWFLYFQVLDILRGPLCDALGEGDSCALYVTDPFQPFSTRLSIAGYGGLALSIPVILWQGWRFVAPGLYAREKRLAIPFVVSGVLLFVLGASLAYWSLPRALSWLLEIGGEELNPLLAPDKYIMLIVKMMIAFGIGFEFPVVLVMLQLVGIVTPKKLASTRRYAIVGIVVMVAVITPDGNPFTLAILSVPMYLFYEISIIIGYIAARRKRRSAAA